MAALVLDCKVEGGHLAVTLAFVHILGIPLTDTSVNPARSIGPALLAGGDALKNLWVFIVAPMIGSVVAVFAVGYLHAGKRA